MFEELDATGYKHNQYFYSNEFKKVLKGIYFCYTIMIKKPEKLKRNNEDMIRDVLVNKYLNDDEICNDAGLTGYLFSIGAKDQNGYPDIKVDLRSTTYPKNSFFNIECKKIGRSSTGLNSLYVTKGIFRFINNEYTSNCGVSAMIGFVVENIQIDINTEKINKILIKKSQFNQTIQDIQKENFITDFNFHYSSKHTDKEGKNFVLYHLMLDFSNVIQ